MMFTGWCYTSWCAFSPRKAKYSPEKVLMRHYFLIFAAEFAAL
jgi:hypothetical protein